MSFGFSDSVGKDLVEKLSPVIDIVKGNLPEGERKGAAFICSSNRDANGSPQICTAVYLFTPNLAVYIREPIRSRATYYEMAPFKGRVDWIRIISRDDESVVEFTTQDGWSGELTAVASDHEQMMKAYVDHILPNFKFA